MNNNNNNTNNNNNNNSTTTYPCRIVTQNIQGLNDVTKQQQLLDAMKIDHIDIMGLSETKLSQQRSKHIYTRNQHYDAYFNNDGDQHSTGIGIIVSKQYSKYIHRAIGYKGRVLYIDLLMKGRIKLRIVQVYLHANFNNNNKKEVLDLHAYIENLILKSYKENYRIIIMGDFNVDPKCYEQSLRTNGSFHWKYNIINKLYAQNMFDTVDFCQDITPQTPFDTYIPNQQNQTSSRIDQIWISEDLVTDTITSNNYISDLYSSDHHALYISFFTDSIFGRKGVASLKQHNMRKRIFTYDEMTSEKWSKFQQDIDTEYNNSNLKDMYINTPTDLNRYWDNI